jgi:hypothetical protein
MGSVHARGDTFLTFGLKALTETNTSRLATGCSTDLEGLNTIGIGNLPNKVLQELQPLKLTFRLYQPEIEIQIWKLQARYCCVNLLIPHNAGVLS